MSTATLQELEGDPLALFQRVEAGESIVLTRDNAAVAEIRPIAPEKKQPRPCGLAAGEFTVPNDFDAPLPDDIIAGFEGR